MKNEHSPHGNFKKLSTAEDFSAGTLHGLTLVKDEGACALRLADGCKVGEFLSPVFDTQPFNDLVVSWNTDTPPGTKAEVFARAYLPDCDDMRNDGGAVYDGWTDWISWGEWSPFIRRACGECSDSHPRADGQPGGWAYAYSYTGGGDSSMRINGGLTASRMQLKAVLSAGQETNACPQLRLLAATFKNTNDPEWNQKCALAEPAVAEKPAVLLNTPAISQLQRDPAYKNVICSATCIAMLLNGRGEDVLPEDITMINYDYGFGGNGNWSFSVATAGAYGYESYVHYADFAGLRQELCRGYAVALSVRYSKEENGKYPYLCNAPTNTGGHLITIVGYRYDETLGEYIYYSNDPASDTDYEVVHREYRESQLSDAWSRRAAYFVHDKKKQSGLFPHRELRGILRALPDRCGVFALVTEAGETLALPADFTDECRRSFGLHGTLALTVSNQIAPLPDGVLRTTANHQFLYEELSVTEDGMLKLPVSALDQAAGGTVLTLYVVVNSGDRYTFLLS